MAEQEKLNLEAAEPVAVKPKRKRRTKAEMEAARAAAALEAEQARILAEAAASAQASSAAESGEEKPKKRRVRRTKAQIEADRAREAAEAAAAGEGEKPKRARRGRKPKSEAAAESVEAAAAPSASLAVQQSDSTEEKPVKRRGRKPKAKQEESAVREAHPSEEKKSPAAVSEKSDVGNAEKNPVAQSDSSQAESAETGEAVSAKRQHRNERSDRNNDRRLRQRDRKQRNNRYNAPTEPSLSRDDLSALKVAELREKAKEFDIDFAGVKKSELVELVYSAAAKAEGFRDIKGILDIDNQGFGYIRAQGYMPSKEDAFVPANMIRAARLRAGDLIEGTLRPSRANDKYPGLAKIATINGRDPEEMRMRPRFNELTPIYPNEPLKMEHGKDSITGRAIDIVSPIGKGQRGLIVSPPKAGKTTILKKICQSIAANNPEVYLICLLVDERPEEVTDMERSIRGDVVASTFDMPADNHTRVSELVIERAKRIVEMGGDVVVVLDSITRLARAYNLAAPASGRILSGGVDSAALYPPKKFLGAARNIENGGSLTILASALIDTGSKMDEVIFEEFKGTGNMELKLDRDLADRRIFPAIDPVASGTRNENLLIEENMQPFFWGLRRILANMNNTERAAAAFIKGLKSTNSNQEFLIRSAKKAAEHPDAL